MSAFGRTAANTADEARSVNQQVPALVSASKLEDVAIDPIHLVLKRKMYNFVSFIPRGTRLYSNSSFHNHSSETHMLIVPGDGCRNGSLVLQSRPARELPEPGKSSCATFIFMA
jgi:hypothetical protein